MQMPATSENSNVLGQLMDSAIPVLAQTQYFVLSQLFRQFRVNSIGSKQPGCPFRSVPFSHGTNNSGSMEGFSTHVGGSYGQLQRQRCQITHSFSASRNRWPTGQIISCASVLATVHCQYLVGSQLFLHLTPNSSGTMQVG